MPDKVSERLYLASLREALPELSSGCFEEHEPPDFVVPSDNRRIGIEFTTFHLSPRAGERPHVEQQSLRDRIAREAHKRYSEAHGPAVYVWISIAENVPLAKNDTRTIGQDIANAVMACRLSIPKKHLFHIPWNQLPERVSAIHVVQSSDGVDQMWSAGAGGWVGKVTTDEVSRVIVAKDRRVKQARTHCDELWLVIVNDHFSRAAPVELSEEARGSTYRCLFDRVIWLIPHGPLAIDLGVG